jgi:hypothetical protein
MDDVLNCPICGDKTRNIHTDNKLLHPVSKTANYTERVCAGHNHTISLWTDRDTKQIDFIKLSLNPSYTRWLEVDNINQKCRIVCAKNGEYEYIEIAKMLDLDFPDLTKLKEKVSIYIVFS